MISTPLELRTEVSTVPSNAIQEATNLFTREVIKFIIYFYRCSRYTNGVSLVIDCESNQSMQDRLCMINKCKYK